MEFLSHYNGAGLAIEQTRITKDRPQPGSVHLKTAGGTNEAFENIDAVAAISM